MGGLHESFESAFSTANVGFSRFDVALRIFDGEFNAGRGDLAFVPEPSTLVLLALGCLGLVRRR